MGPSDVQPRFSLCISDTQGKSDAEDKNTREDSMTVCDENPAASLDLTPRIQPIMTPTKINTTSDEPMDWSTDHTVQHCCRLLSTSKLTHSIAGLAAALRKHDVTGSIFLLDINHTALKHDLNIDIIHTRGVILREIDRLRAGSRKYLAYIEHYSPPVSHLHKRPRVSSSFEGEISTPAQTSAEGKLKNARKEIQRLDADICDLNSKVRLLGKENLRLGREVATKHLSSLKENFGTHLSTTKFRNLTGKSQMLFSPTTINRGFADIYWEIEHLGPSIPDMDRWKSKPSCTNAELGKLITRCLQDLEHPSQVIDTASLLTRLSPFSAVRALAMAALLLWVFETDYPQFGGPSELLTSYRKIIAGEGTTPVLYYYSLLTTIVGTTGLRNLDLAAREISTLSHTFRNEEISDKARELSIRLSWVLAPLFTDPIQHQEDFDGFATWGDDKELSKDRRGRCEQMFRAALRTKADLLLNIEEYQAVMYPPGTLFDESSMMTDTFDGINGGAAHGRSIALCITAAIFRWNRVDVNDDFQISDAIVTNNFLGRRRDRASRPVIKAVVVILPDEPESDILA
jgi:hypothetical protein